MTGSIPIPDIPYHTLNLGGRLEGLLREKKDDGSFKENGDKIKEVCSLFESLFIQFLLRQMRKTIAPSDLFGNGIAKDLYHSIIDQELSGYLSQKRGIGLSSLLYRQFEKEEEKPKIRLKF